MLKGTQGTRPPARAPRLRAGVNAPALRRACPMTAGGQSPRQRQPDRVAAGRGTGCGVRWSLPNRRAGAGKRGAFPCPPGVKAGLRRCHGRGHRPCHIAALGSGPAGGQSPRPAPDPPPAGASRPPGRALACVVLGPDDLQGTVARGRGNAMRFLFPPGVVEAVSPLQWQRPSPLPRRNVACRKPGAKPRPVPALTRRTLAYVVQGTRVVAAPSRRGGGNAVRLLVRPDGRPLVRTWAGCARPGGGRSLLQQPGARPRAPPVQT
jgi:hypothetical protein